MKKALFSKITLAALSVLVLAGCTTTTNPPVVTDPPVVEDPVKESFTSYFNSTVYAEFITQNDYVTDVDNSVKSFNDLAKRQVELLADDILYRLFAVYGSGAAADSASSIHYLRDADDNTFSYNGNHAQVHTYNILKNYSSLSDGNPIYTYADGTEVKDGFAVYAVQNPDIAEVATYAYALKDDTWQATVSNIFLNKDSINGGYTFNGTNFSTTSFNRLEAAWNWNYDGLLITPSSSILNAYNAFYNAYYNTLKTDIAILLSNANTTSYDGAIAEIDHLGFTATDKQNIVNYINETVIGGDLVATDNQLLNTVTTKLNGTEINTSNYGNLNTNDHYYKAYGLLIPAIVNQAVSSTFATTTKGIYPVANKLEQDSSNLTYNAVTNKNFTQIKITPKANNTPLTKLVVKFAGTGINNATIRYTVKTSATGSTIVNNAALSVTNNANKVIDFSTYYNNYKLSTSGYILFTISNNSSPFTVTFDGYFNKI